MGTRWSLGLRAMLLMTVLPSGALATRRMAWPPPAKRGELRVHVLVGPVEPLHARRRQLAPGQRLAHGPLIAPAPGAALQQQPEPGPPPRQGLGDQELPHERIPRGDPEGVAGRQAVIDEVRGGRPGRHDEQVVLVDVRQARDDGGAMQPPKHRHEVRHLRELELGSARAGTPWWSLTTSSSLRPPSRPPWALSSEMASSAPRRMASPAVAEPELMSAWSPRTIPGGLPTGLSCALAAPPTSRATHSIHPSRCMYAPQVAHPKPIYPGANGDNASSPDAQPPRLPLACD